jgi:hypothetical protein
MVVARDEPARPGGPGVRVAAVGIGRTARLERCWLVHLRSHSYRLPEEAPPVLADLAARERHLLQADQDVKGDQDIKGGAALGEGLRRVAVVLRVAGR